MVQENGKRIKFKMAEQSSAASFCAVLTAIASAVLIAEYWPVFADYFGTRERATASMVTVYGLLICCMLLVSLSTWLFAKKVTGVTAVFAAPIWVFYILNPCGVIKTIAGFRAADFFWYYKENADYLKMWWVFIVPLFIITVAAMCSFNSIAFNRSKGKAFPVLALVINLVAWAGFGVYQLGVVDYDKYKYGESTLRDFFYAIAGYIVPLLFFLSMLVLAVSLRKTLVEAKPSRKAGPDPDNLLLSGEKTEPVMLSEHSTGENGAASDVGSLKEASPQAEKATETEETANEGGDAGMPEEASTQDEKVAEAAEAVSEAGGTPEEASPQEEKAAEPDADEKAPESEAVKAPTARKKQGKQEKGKA